MKCNEFEILIDDYIEGALSSGVKNEFELHKQDCKSCRSEYGETVKLLEKMNTVPAAIAPAHDLWANIESRISDGKAKKNKIFNIRSNKSNNGYADNWESDKKNKYLKYAAIALIAAMILVAILPSIFLNKNTQILDKVMTPYWKVTKLSGITVSASNTMKEIDSLKLGDWFETKDSSRALLDVPGLGSVTVEPNTKLRIVRSDSNEQRIDLEYGTINADINAKPRTFFVDSKSATAIDLGCSYTYTVSPSGDGILYVKQGMVSLQSNGRESLVPEGKFCLARAGIGPGTPFRENTSAALKDALMKYDFEKGGDKEVETIIKNSKKSDMVTLINLMSRVDDENKARLYAHITHYAPPPRDIPKDSIPNIDVKDLNEWIQKFQKEWKEEMQKNMKELQENLKNMSKELRENLSKLPETEFDNGQFNEDLQQKIQENIEKHMDKLENLDKMIPPELIEKSVQESLEKATEEIERNSEKIDREMERLQERLQRMNERMQENMERQKERQEERDEELKEKEKDREEQLNEREKEREQRIKEKQKEYNEKHKDYWKNYKYNFNWETPESPVTPEVETPDVQTPDVETPEVGTPEVETPQVESPDVEKPGKTETPEEK